MTYTDRFLGQDHTVVQYIIEGQYNLNCSDSYAGKWSYLGDNIFPEHFGERHAKYGEKWVDVCPFFLAYKDGWQVTGHSGYAKEELAKEAFLRFIQNYPRDGYYINFRLTKRIVTVKNETVDSLY